MSTADHHGHSGRRFDTVLVANRGEIAVRVIRSARAAGYRTVAVFSDADRDAPHVALADAAVRLGPAPAAESYLDVALVIAAARRSGAQAIHPGYGFLSENAAFAEACTEAGITFIGPTAENIRLMGDKAAAKRRMADAGVPLLPGYQGEEQDDERLVAEAEAIGYPLMVKAAAGGGGKGMRVVEEAGGLADAIQAARREALGAFGSDTLILERALRRPRHVEIQVLADEHGHVIALGERDCSVQRRHQKVIEEAPSPAIDEATRQSMQAAAVQAARDISYVGAGTVEFLFDTGDDGKPMFAFLEMNTRLQVEHPVTELVTGLDLVDWQLRIAQGERLTVAQDDVRLDGHAIEVRLYAEDPLSGYLPQTGTVHVWQPPSGDGVRVDAGIREGQQVTAHYDPMLAKVIAHGRDRDEARRRLADALDRTVLLGVTTNRTFLAEVLRDEVFAAGDATTAYLDEHAVTLTKLTTEAIAAIAGRRWFDLADRAGDRSPGLTGWTNSAWLAARSLLRIGDDEHDVRVRPLGDGTLDVAVEGAQHTVAQTAGGVAVDEISSPLAVHDLGEGRLLVHLPHLDLVVDDVLLQPPSDASAGGAGVLVAPMHGAVTNVPVAVGDLVDAGDPVVVMEAMKMEHVVRADIAGTVTEVAALGAQVADRDVVARIEPTG